jgi:hypothetical protein
MKKNFWTLIYVVLDPEKNDLSSEGHLTKTLFIAVFGIFYIKMNTFQGYSCASSNIDPPYWTGYQLASLP